MVEIIDQEKRKKQFGDSFQCEICGNEFHGAWTDFHGQATCNVCGTPYQLKAYSGAKPDEKFPRIDIKREWIWLFKEYWDETQRKFRHGMYIIPRDYPGVTEEHKAFNEWVKEKHPELIKTT